ncbi:hypothetical protein BZZ01_23290 [Nostocales cyanobacterium HT-58-2]|nr:hypothetical protein BZZ01_23290 [Nostocales cyanobacterium HT-58-2]
MKKVAEQRIRGCGNKQTRRGNLSPSGYFLQRGYANGSSDSTETGATALGSQGKQEGFPT